MVNNYGIKRAEENIKSGINEIAEKGKEVTETVKRSVADKLSNVGEQVNQKSDTAGEYLEKGTSQVFDIAKRTIHNANSAAHRAGDALSGASDYVRNTDLATASRDIRNTVSEHPSIGIVVAGLFGLAIGLMIGRRSSR